MKRFYLMADGCNMGTVEGSDDYTINDYIKDCDHAGADEAWMEMLNTVDCYLEEIEED